MERIEKWLSRWILEHPLLLFILSIILIAALIAGGKNLHFENDYRVYFSEDNPELLAFEELENTYTKNDNVLFVVAPKSGQIFTQENLSILEEMTEAAWQIPYSIRVDSITNFQHTEAKFDDLVVRDLVVDGSELSDEEVSAIQEIALNDPILKNLLVSETGHVSGLNLSLIHI